jgi:ABC-type sugar transport system ATPase subunit
MIMASGAALLTDRPIFSSPDPAKDTRLMVFTAPAVRAAPLLTARNVTKTFGSTRALTDGRIALRPGEVCGLLGANGAGKSTLSRIISGHIQKTAGEITFDGAPYSARSARDALQAGIALVAQETSLAPDMSVLENIFLPDLARPGRISFRALRARAEVILRQLGHEHALPLDGPVRDLSAAQRQLVEIAKALALDARLVIFDEPTASLSAAEVDRLFTIMARLRDQRRALAFVSHRMEEVFAMTDRVTILREGACVVDDVETATLTQGDIIRHMVGRDLGRIYKARNPAEASRSQETVFEVRNLKSAPWVRDMSFAVRKGEILGLGGLVGAGRSEVVEAIFGLRPLQAGQIRVKGQPCVLHRPAQAVAAGLALVAEDRRAQSIIPDMTVRENLMLAHLGRHAGFGRGFGQRAARAAQLIARLGLPADRLDTSLLNFSGGMQQKIIIARWLLIDPDVLILDEPTKGVDIGTRASIYEIMQEIADAGTAVIVISSDFEELLGICERVVVVSDGLTIADLPAALLTPEKLTLLAAPRTSTARNTAFLRRLVARHGGTAFWVLIDGPEVICLTTEAAPGSPPIGIAPGEAVRAEQTSIAAVLAARGADFVTDARGQSTLIVQMQDRRGNDLGWIGLTLPAGSTLPPVADLTDEIKSLSATQEDA